MPLMLRQLTHVHREASAGAETAEVAIEAIAVIVAEAAAVVITPRQLNKHIHFIRKGWSFIWLSLFLFCLGA